MNSPIHGHLKKEVNMEIKVNAIHFEATEKLNDFINKKVEKLAKQNELVSGAEVILKVVKPETAMNKEASVRLKVPRSEDLFASKVADTFEEAIDNCVDALKRQIEKGRRDK
jgi:integrase/recombinase XerC